MCVYHAGSFGKSRARLINNSFWAHGSMANAHFAERRQNYSGARKVMRSNLAVKSHY
ncbi:hypothetical protein PSN_1241 [Pseudomonas sp. NGC7]